MVNEENSKQKSWLKKLGPGLITGAADDDPSGIATYSQAGAQFGFNMLWTVLFTYPFMVSIQLISARIGRVSGQGLSANIRRHYPKWLLYFIVGLLLVANTINIAADISAMGNALSLVVGGYSWIYALLFGLVSILLEVFIPYKRYVRVLKWLTLALLAYVATVIVEVVPWQNVLVKTILPNFSWNSSYITTLVAVFGTTISPYLFFWQASQEVEEIKADPKSRATKKSPEQISLGLKRIKIDTFVGMGFSNLVAYFIILTAAVTLFKNGIHDVQTAEQAATALRPIAGEFAFLIFSLGIIGTGLLAVPILAGASAFAMAEAFNWKSGLELQPKKAKNFYGVVVISILLGILLGFVGLNPIKALYWSAVINGIISVPIMVVMLLMATRTDIMGLFTISRRLKIWGWMATAIMAFAVLAMFIAQMSVG